MDIYEIEDCDPDGALSDDETGKTLVSAQWLHDFARNIAAAEREACAKVCEEQGHESECQERAQYCADAIRMRYVA